MLGDVGKRFLRDPVHHFRGCIVRFDTDSGPFGTEANGYSGFALPLSSQLAQRGSQVAAKGYTSGVRPRNRSQLIAEPVQQLTKVGERTAHGGVGDRLLESGKSKRNPHQVLPGMIMQVARYPQTFLPDSVLNCGIPFSNMLHINR